MKVLLVEITPRCDLSCRFCYNPWRDPQSQLQAQGAVLRPQEWIQRLSEWTREVGPASICLTGGEPLLYPELDRLVTGLSEALPLCPIGLGSHGLHLTPARLAHLRQCGLAFAWISLLAAHAEEFQRLSGVNGWALQQRHLAAARAEGLRLTAAIPMTRRLSSEHLRTMIAVSSALAVDQIALLPFVPSGRGTERRDELALRRSELLALLDCAAQAARSQPKLEIAVSLPLPADLVARWPELHCSRCICGEQRWTVDWQGRLRLCEQDDQVVGVLGQDPWPLLQARCRQRRAQRGCPAAWHAAECEGSADGPWP